MVRLNMELSSFGQAWSSSLAITLGAQKLKRQKCPQRAQKGQHPLKHHYVLDANESQCHESSTVSLPCVGCVLFDALTLLFGSQGVKLSLNCEGWCERCTAWRHIYPSSEVPSPLQKGSNTIQKWFFNIFNIAIGIFWSSMVLWECYMLQEECASCSFLSRCYTMYHHIHPKQFTMW